MRTHVLKQKHSRYTKHAKNGMNKTYRISNDGTIFEIKEDGSIAKLAKIDDAGNISTIRNAEKDRLNIPQHHNSVSKVEYDKTQAICDNIDMLRSRSHTTVTIDALIDKLFPINGIKLGVTSHSDLQKLGYNSNWIKPFFPSAFSSIPGTSDELIDILNGSFGYGGVTHGYFYKDNISGHFDAKGIITDIMFLVSDDMPIQWYNAFGFSSKLSYNEWVVLLKKNNFKITDTQEPVVIKEKVGFLRWKDRFSATFNARYPNSAYQLKFVFSRFIENKQPITNDTSNVIASITIEPIKL